MRPASATPGQTTPHRPSTPPLVRAGSSLGVPSQAQRAFIEALARTGSVAQAARAASPDADPARAAVSTFRDARNSDPDFAAAWAQTLDEADGDQLDSRRNDVRLIQDEVTATETRLRQLQVRLETARDDIATASPLLVEAVADEDERAAKGLRSNVTRLGQRVTELEAAIPVAQERLEKARERAAARTRLSSRRAACPASRTSTPAGPSPFSTGRQAPPSFSDHYEALARARARLPPLV